MVKSLYLKESYVDLGEKFLDINKSTTIMLWFKVLDVSKEQALVAQNEDGSSAGRASFGVFKNKIYYFKSASPNFTIYSENEIQSNKWYHLAVVTNNKNVKVYLNGILEIDKTDDKAFLNSNTYLFASHNGKNYFFDGYCYDIKIYDYNMSEYNIKNSMDTALYDNLIRYYSFNNSTATSNGVVKDKIGNKDIVINNYRTLSPDIPITPFKTLFLVRDEEKVYYDNGQVGTYPPSEDIFKEYGLGDIEDLFNEDSSNIRLKKNQMLENGIVYSAKINKKNWDKVEYIKGYI